VTVFSKTVILVLAALASGIEPTARFCLMPISLAGGRGTFIGVWDWPKAFFKRPWANIAGGRLAGSGPGRVSPSARGPFYCPFALVLSLEAPEWPSGALLGALQA